MNTTAPTQTTTAGSDPAEVKAAGLRFVTDRQPGLRREPDGDGFRYIAPDGTVVEDEKTLARIKSLGIPPAYTDVWICRQENGYLQATGHDAKGRKQYRYHPRWRETRDETKYEHMMAFGEALPRIRARVEHDLARHGLAREKVLATVVRLLETTLIRVGNKEYAEENHHYGLTTMQQEHVDVEGATLHFHFVGKSGKEHTIDVKDRRLARVVQRLRDLPGEEIFQYTDDEGKRHTIDSADVNDYLHEITGAHFTAKDFRTWAGTVLASLALQEFEAFDTKTQAKKERDGRYQSRLPAPRQHARHLPQVLRPPRRAGHVPGRHHASRPGAARRAGTGGHAALPAPRRSRCHGPAQSASGGGSGG